MKINAIQIERMTSEQEYCGTLDYRDEAGEGTLLWTVDAQPLRIHVAFVQGSVDNWDEVARQHAHVFSDNVILAIARHSGMPALASGSASLFPV
ncbi:MAG: hypothetical protein ACO1RX_14175 [Candidatus Sericytochromatia bacterium]